MIPSTSHPALIEYPERARLGRVVPKNRIALAAHSSSRVREQLTTHVAKIIWQFKLARETLNLHGSKAVPEIQVFTLALKATGINDALPVELLKYIDQAIGFPIIFELTASREDGASHEAIRVAATYKRPSEADPGKWVTGDYFATDWLSAVAPRAPLPVSLDLTRLYEQLIRQLIPVQARPGELLTSLLERQRRIASMQRECHRLKARIQREKQFNRKVSLNRQFRELKTELEALENIIQRRT